MSSLILVNMDGSLTITIDRKHVAEFKSFVQRASNLAPDLSPVMKSFADYVTNGRTMQNYFLTQPGVPEVDKQIPSDILHLDVRKDL